VFDFEEKPQAGVKWQDCYGGPFDNEADCLANKGLYHAQLKVPNDLDPRNPVVLDVINLHHDAGNCDKNRKDPTENRDCAENAATRLKQLQQLKGHLDFFPDSLFVVAGDFNTVAPPWKGVAEADKDEYPRIKQQLDQAGQREFRDAWLEGGDGGWGFTADSLAQTVNRTCTAEPGELGCRQERIDHIWVSDAGTCYRLKVKDVRVETMPANGRVPSHDKCKNGSCEHLSDHFGVSSTIEIWRDNTRLSAPPCGGQLLVEILDPPGRVTAAETRTLRVGTPADATGVRLLVDGSSADISLVESDGMTHTFEWSVPDQQVNELSHRLRAEATIAGTLRFHEVTVRATKSFGPGSVKFVNPVEGQEVVWVGATETVKVSAPGATGVELTISPADGGAGGSMTETAPGSGAWLWEGWRPASAGTRYQLVAQASPPSVGNAQIWVKAVDPVGLQIVWPTPSSTLTFGKRAQVVVAAPWNATDIRLAVTRGLTTLELGPRRRFNDLSHSSWEFEWTPPDVTNGFPFVLQAHDGSGAYGPSPTVAVEVTTTADAIAPAVEFLQPGPDQKLAARGSVTFPVLVKASDNQGVTSVALEVSGPQPQTLTSSVSCGPYCHQFVWSTSKAGRYTLEATASDDSGNHRTASVGVDVTILSYPMEKTLIDRDSFLLRIWDIGDDDPEDDVVSVSTGIPAGRYACAIVGYKASGGDIEEEKGGREIIRAILDHPGDDWRLHLNFKTGGRYATGLIPLPVPPWFWPTYDYTDRPETWEATLFCASRELASLDGPEPGKPIFLKTYAGLGHDVYHPTEIPTSDYACGVAGFFNTRGDVNEKDSRDPIEVYTYDAGGYWHIRAGFATHGGERQEWTVNLICFGSEAAAVGGPMPGKRYFVKQLGRFNDPAEGTTGVSDRYACGLVGFRSFAGNIDEHNKDGAPPLFWAYLYPHGDGTWHFRGDVRSEGDHEDWERVSILCATRGPTANEPPQIAPVSSRFYLSLSQWQRFDLELEASDANWDEVRLFAASLPDGAAFPEQTGKTRVKGTFRFTLPVLGEMEWRDVPITFTAADHELSSAKTVTIRVCGTGIADCERLRHYPRLGPLADQQLMAGQPLSFRVAATDKDDDWLLLKVGCNAVQVAPRTTRCQDGPVGAELTIEDSFEGYAQALFTWTPDAPAVYSVRFSAYDTDASGSRADGNDHATIRITVTENPASLPDLTVLALGWPTTAAPGATVNFTYMVKNEGTAAALAGNGGFLTRLLVDGQPVPDGGGRVGSRRTTLLAAGASSTSGFQWQASCGTRRDPVELEISVETDAERQVLEKRESNNRTPIHRLLVDCTPPDLVVVPGSICTPEQALRGSPDRASRAGPEPGAGRGARLARGVRHVQERLPRRARSAGRSGYPGSRLLPHGPLCGPLGVVRDGGQPRRGGGGGRGQQHAGRKRPRRGAVPAADPAGLDGSGDPLHTLHPAARRAGHDRGRGLQPRERALYRRGGSHLLRGGQAGELRPRPVRRVARFRPRPGREQVGELCVPGPVAGHPPREGRGHGLRRGVELLQQRDDDPDRRQEPDTGRRADRIARACIFSSCPRRPASTRAGCCRRSTRRCSGPSSSR
jgi:hypothetical protein